MWAWNPTRSFSKRLFAIGIRRKRLGGESLNSLRAISTDDSLKYMFGKNVSKELPVAGLCSRPVICVSHPTVWAMIFVA